MSKASCVLCLVKDEGRTWRDNAYTDTSIMESSGKDVKKTDSTLVVLENGVSRDVSLPSPSIHLNQEV